MKKLLTPLIALMLATAVKAQTATPMAQYAGNQMIFNPGFAGAHDLFSANLSMKRLWIGMPNPPQLISFNMHAPFINHRNALGFIYQRETFGPQAINLVNLTYAYNFQVGEGSFLSLGVQAGLLNSVTDWDMVDIVRDRDDPALGQGRMVRNNFDMGLGAYFQARNFYVGLSVRHLTVPRFFDDMYNETIGITHRSQVRRQFFMMGGYNIVLSDAFNLRPRILMRHKQGVPFTVSAGMDLVYDNRFSFGANIMSGLPAVTLSASVEIFEGFRIGYAFDMNFGTIRDFQRGSHEIFIGYFMPIWTRSNDTQTRQHFR